MSPRLGLGLAALGRPGYVTLNHARDLGGSYDPSTMESHAHDVLDAAFDSGIRYIDAARSYGKAEDFLASWLRKRAIEPGEITVASKWGYTYTAGWSTSAAQHEIKDHSLAAFERLYFGHATKDQGMGAEAIEKLEWALRSRGGDYASEMYDAAHGWMIPGGRVYDPENAERGFEKMSQLFDDTLQTAEARR